MFDCWSQNTHITVFHTCDRRESKYAEVLVGLPLSVMISISRGWGVAPKQKRWEKGMCTQFVFECVYWESKKLKPSDIFQKSHEI